MCYFITALFNKFIIYLFYNKTMVFYFMYCIGSKFYFDRIMIVNE